MTGIEKTIVSTLCVAGALRFETICKQVMGSTSDVNRSRCQSALNSLKRKRIVYDPYRGTPDEGSTYAVTDKGRRL